MGETTKYKLPWPELTDSADGPLGFQNLATKVESSLVSESANKLITAGSGGSRNYAFGSTGKLKVLFGAPFRVGTRPCLSIHVVSSGSYVLNLDGSLISHGLDHTGFGIQLYISSTGLAATARTLALHWVAVGIMA